MGTLQAEEVAVYALSYDPVETLARFAAGRDITYTLLSDVGSVVIEKLGLLNGNVREHHGFYGVQWQPKYEGVPYPGVFALDGDGMITDKRFNQSYRVRETGAGTLARALDIAKPPSITATGSADSIEVDVSLDADEYVSYQQLWLTATLRLAAGWHCYGEPTPEGFIAAKVTVDPLEGLLVGETVWPPPSPFSMDGLDDTFYVYGGIARARVPLTFAMRGTGAQTVSGSVSFQVCTETECLPPAMVKFSFILPEGPHAAAAN